MLVWDCDGEEPSIMTVFHDMGEGYEYRYLAQSYEKRIVSFFRYVKEIVEEPIEPTRYFFLTYSVLRQNTTDTVNYSAKFNRFPTHKECIEFGEEEAIKNGNFKSVFLLAMTEVNAEDFEIFISETK